MATEPRTRAASGNPRNSDGAVIAVADLTPLLDALRAAARGETGVRLDAHGRGPVGQLAKAFNHLAELREKTTDEIVRLEERAEQLASSSRYESEFLANMSHELRTPLNSVLVLAKLMSANADGALRPKQVEFARTIHTAGSDLLLLINDILDLSKLEAGKMDVDPQPVQPVALADFVNRNFGPVADQKNLSLSIELAEGLPPAIVTDEQRLQQVLKNLLSNAFKFTRAGAVTLTIAPAPAGSRFGEETLRAGESVIQFAVKDTGIGISGDKLNLIFEAFQQADGTTSRRYGGTGLGLSISREVAHLLGGEIRVVSQPGEGSTFTLSLPLVAIPVATGDEGLGIDAAVALPRAEPELSAQSRRVLEQLLPADDVLEGKRVLIADDDVRNVFALASLLEEHGVEVCFAENGNEAIVRLEADPEIDLVLMDTMMPELDGHEAMRLIREQPRFAQLPIISVTAKAMKGDREKSIASGASDYVTKPVDTDRLLALLRLWLYQ